jgi:RNA polymerase sigma-70 factor (ECF subfamily)
MGTALEQTGNLPLTVLVRRAQEGERAAFERLLRETQPLARRIAFSILPRNLVDDALQESYLLVFRKLPQLKAPEAFTGWLSRLVLHVCYRIRSKHPREDELTEQASVSEPTASLVDGLALRQALRRLHQRDRDVLILREMLALSYEEIAYALQIPVGTVRSRLSTARRHLADRLNGEISGCPPTLQTMVSTGSEGVSSQA